ncbi:hypothetical protein LSTR_LSTR016119, partial [Laodelphax striatellus]
MEELASLLLVKRDARRPWRPYKRKPLPNTSTTQSTILSSLLPNYSTTINRLSNYDDDKSTSHPSDTDKVLTFFTKNYATTRSDVATTSPKQQVTSGTTTVSSFERFFDDRTSFGVDNNRTKTGSNRFLSSDKVVPTGFPDESNDLWWGTVLWDEVGVVGGAEAGNLNLSWNVTLDQNMTTTNRDGEDDGSGEVVVMIVTAFLLGLIILATVIG